MSDTATLLFSGTMNDFKIGANVAGLADMGYVGDEISLSVTIENQDLTAGQSITPISTTFKLRKYQLKFSFAEYALTAIAYALGQAVATAGTGDTYLHAASTAPDTVCIQAKVKNDNEATNKYYTLTCYSCKLAAGGTVSFVKGQQGFMECTFDVLDNSGFPFSIEKSAS
jgi:hypothetical protein